MAVPTPTRFAECVRGPPGPYRRVLPVRSLEHDGSPPSPLRPRDNGHGDHLAHFYRLVGRPGSLCIRGVDGGDDGPITRRAPTDSAAAGVLLRTATCISGKVEVEAVCIPLFDYGVGIGQWTYDGDGYDSLRTQAPGGDLTLSLKSSLQLGVAGARCYGRTSLTEGQDCFIALTWGGQPPKDQDEADGDLASTVAYWRDWLATGTFPDHPWRPYIERSALTLKGLSYAPTGAIMAASTTSLPETPGGARNWDYRSRGSETPVSCSVRSIAWGSTGKLSSISPLCSSR